MERILLIVGLACLLVGSGMANAQSLQALQPIRDAALAALQADASAQASIAPGLRLAACSQPLQATASGKSAAEVRCPDTPGWRLYVPVRNPNLRSVADAEQGQGAPLVSVKRGDPVVLRASIGGIEVRMGGRALGAAVAGGIVNVENDNSHRIIRGRLGADGSVEVVNE
jgi:flagellar basal body P-ring formation protein FlgA